MVTPAGLPIDSVWIREVRLPLRRGYRSGSTSLDERRVLLLAVRSGDLVGWGECGPIPGYSHETVEECLETLRTWAIAATEGRPAEPTSPAAARFAITGAINDLRGQLEGIPCWRMLGGGVPEVEAGAVIGLDLDGSDLVSAARDLADQGYHRVKLKVAPGRCRERAQALRLALPESSLAVDGNGSFAPGDEAELYDVDALGLAFIEQPHPRGNEEATADLASRLETPLCLDESIGDLRSAAEAIDAGVPWMFNIKPARVGGMDVAALITSMAAAAGRPVWCGSMLETGVGKAAALAIATLPGMAAPADLGPSARHFATDLVDWPMTNGAIRVPDKPGLGIDVDPEVVDRFAAAAEVHGAGF